MIVECVKCGKEYELSSIDDLSSYQCVCGGDLRSKAKTESDVGVYLFPCPSCGRYVSKKDYSCPRCGLTVESDKEEQLNENEPNKDSIKLQNNSESTSRDKIVHGYSFTDNKGFKYKIITIFGIAILLIGVLGLITFNIIGLILAVSGFVILYAGYSGGYSWIKGDKGEKIVSQYLEDLPRGYFVFNDVNIPSGKGNFDHLVVGPTGVFLIETKNYSGYFSIDGDDWFIGSNKLKRNPGTQVKLNALDLSKFLNKQFGKKTWVIGVVTLLNNNFTVIKKPRYYDVVYAADLTRFISKGKNKHSKQAVNKIVNFMQDYSTEIHYKKEDAEIEYAD